MSKTRFTVDRGVWLSQYALSTPNDLRAGKGHDELQFWGGDMKDSGYTLIGTASVTFEVMEEDEMVKSAVESLTAQLQKERADSQVRQNYLADKIQKLLAISHEVAA